MATDKKAQGPADYGKSQVDAAVQEDEDKGYHGTKVDPTPNEAYTVAGVTAGMPTPETDPALRAAAEVEVGLEQPPAPDAA